MIYFALLTAGVVWFLLGFFWGFVAFFLVYVSLAEAGEALWSATRFVVKRASED